MENKSRKIATWAGLGVFITLFYLGWIICGPDQDLQFIREIPASVPVEPIERNLADLGNWPKWFHSLTRARRVDLEKQILEMGAVIELEIKSRRAFAKGFKVRAQVTGIESNRRLRLRILDDSTGRLNRLFETLDWEVELRSQVENSRNRVVVVGKVFAHTKNWRSRLFGKLATKILMHQVFYPDLLKLAQIRTEETQSPFFPPRVQ